LFVTDGHDPGGGRGQLEELVETHLAPANEVGQQRRHVSPMTSPGEPGDNQVNKRGVLDTAV
jgi:hypothetical protein